MSATGYAAGRTALRGALVTSAWTFVSRLAGYARDALLAAVFGMSPLLGALHLAWMVPNLFRRVLGEGAMAAVVQPVLARREHAAGAIAAREGFALLHGSVLCALTLFVCAGCVVLLAAWVLLPADEGHRETRRALLFALALLPFVAPTSLAALHAAPQNLAGRFFIPALGPVVLNLFWIAALLWPLPQGAADDRRAWVMIAAILVGGAIQWLVQLHGLQAAGYPARPRRDPMSPDLRGAVRGVAPALFALGAVQLTLVTDQIAVRWLVDGSANSYAYYAHRLLHLPLALVGLAAATGVMPLLARAAAERDLTTLGDALRRGAHVLLWLILAAAAGLHAVAEPCVRALFERAQFTPEHTRLLADTLRAYLWSLPPAALAALLVRAYLACGHTRLPVIAAALVLPLHLAGVLFLVPRCGVPGAGWATAMALATQCALLAGGLGQIGLRGLPARARDLPQLLVPGCAAWCAARCALIPFGGDGAGLVGLACAIGAGAAAALLLCALLRPGDLRDLAHALRRGGAAR
jgi:putative peptidoglycan lipid II flippase